MWTKITVNTTVVTPLFNHGNNKISLNVCDNTETLSITIPLASDMLKAIEHVSYYTINTHSSLAVGQYSIIYLFSPYYSTIIEKPVND